METTDPIPRPQCLASQEDGGIGTKMDLDPVRDQTEVTHGSPLETSGERLQDDTKVPAHKVIPRYYSVMDDEGVDDLFIPPAPPPSVPSHVAGLLPEDSTGATESNSNLTLANEAADATEAKANPGGLDWHHDEKQLMAAQQNKVNEVIAGTSQTSKDFTDTVPLSNASARSSDQELTSMECTSSLMAPSGRNHPHDAKEEDESDSKEEAEDIVNLCEGHDKRSEIDLAGDKYPKQIPLNIEENSERKLTAENLDCNNAETIAPTSELCKYNQNKTEAATTQTQVGEIPREVTNDDDDEHFDTRSLNFNLKKCDWPSISEDMSKEYVTKTLSPEMVRKEQRGDASLRIATEIQQGEQLLQRLQLLQLRQDEDMSESPSTSQQFVQDRRVEERFVLGSEDDSFKESRGDLTDEDETDETAKMNLKKTKDIERNESEDARISVVFAHQQIQEPAQGKQNLQRAEGVLNLAENPDVLEIPFASNVPFESLSAEKMKTHNEISQETQKEMVLVIQGKTPGESSKGEVHQLHKTKLLFEAFQQDNAEGPTRHRKPPTSSRKGYNFPSVLERTRSLEVVSRQSLPISRAHSLRLCKSPTSEREKSPENISSKSSNELSRDKTRLFPYPKQDLRLYRSMDSISTDVPTTAVETRQLSMEGNRTKDSPILRQNPFFKLRPALALQPEVEKDIREARKREEELRRQRSTLYGENRQDTEEEEMSATLISGSKQQSRGKLELVWPPPSKKDKIKSEQTQEPKVHRTGDQKAPLWQRWESGQINGKASEDKN